MTILFIALTLDILLGEAPNRFHPVCFMGRWAAWCESFFRNRLGGSFFSGTCAALAVILPFAFAGAGLVWLVPAAWTQVVAGAVVYVCLAPRSLAEHAKAVACALDDNALPAARSAVSRMVGRETDQLDGHAVARAAVESVGENLVDGVLASLFWAAAGLGLGHMLDTGSALLAPTLAAGLSVAHRATNTLDAMWGKRTERYARFGTFAARLDDGLAFVPARLSLLLIAVAALSLHGTPRVFWEALRMGYRDRSAHASPNSAWSEAAFAGALNLQLSGPLYYAGVLRESPWIGDGTPDATPEHIREAVSLMWRTTLLFALCAGLFLDLF